MTVVVIKIVCLAGMRVSTPADGKYLRAMDFEGRGGRGTIGVTPNLDEAMKFEDAGVAMQYWRTRSKTVPTRPDGKPNRPLTAFTVEITKI
jgi:hypothetical protein